MSPRTPPAMLDSISPGDLAEENRVFAKISRLLIPFMFLLYVVGYLDRINVGFAALTMKADLGLSEKAYGFGAGFFFIGYFLFEVPSNLVLEKVGARRWIARIMVTWGIIACGMMFIRGAISFNAMRFLLGAAEAGFFPGMVLYLTYWYPAKRRAKAMSAFLTSTAIAGVIGAPLSAICLNMNGVGHLAGWQWLFLLQGLPSVILGVVVLFYLPDGPNQATWLTDDEQRWLDEHLTADRVTAAGRHRHTLVEAMKDSRLWLLSAIYFLLIAGLYTFSLWAPAVLKKAVPELGDSKVALLLAIPYSVASIGMVSIARHSDHTGERHWHIAVPSALAFVGLTATVFAHTAPLALFTLSIAALGIWSTLGIFWTLPTSFLRGNAAAGGIAIVNSIGCLSGFVAPYAIGLSRERSGGFAAGLIGVGITVLCGGLLVFRVRVHPGESE